MFTLALAAVLVGRSAFAMEGLEGAALGLEVGYELPFGSNGSAFAGAPALRIAGTRYQGMYAPQLAYGFARHAVVNASDLYATPTDAPIEGHVDLHTVYIGSRIYPLAPAAAAAATADPARVSPWVGSGVAIVAALGSVAPSQFPTLHQVTATYHFQVELAGGCDVRVSERVSVDASARLAMLPALRGNSDGTTRFETLWLFGPVLSAAWHL
jgi:hypothetical protein